jgi:transcriptional regulator with XRE-family HTH domain
MEFEIAMVAERIRGLREILDISVEEMAGVCEVSVEEYLEYEAGRRDFYFTFLYKAAQRFGIELTELVTGDVPRLSVYTLVRQGNGMPIKRKKEFDYINLAYLFKDKLAEPFLVTVKYDEKAQSLPIPVSHHKGQEFDYILKGKLKFRIDAYEEELSAGDSIYTTRPTPRPHRGGRRGLPHLAVVIKE